MRVLIMCADSGIGRAAFLAMGHDAWSCDLLPCKKPGPHIIGDGLTILDRGWDLMIAHPPCQYLSVSGIHWNNRGRGWDGTEKAVVFFMALANAPIRQICIENPRCIMSTRWRKPDQYIQPHQFGHDASKETALWLKGLPLLIATGPHIAPRIVNGKPRWANQTDSGQNRLGPSPDRAAIRAITYSGIAKAMADQWSI